MAEEWMSFFFFNKTWWCNARCLFTRDDGFFISLATVSGRYCTEASQPRELKPPRVMEALAASGSRALRYAREVNGIGQIVALGNDRTSIEAYKGSTQFNVYPRHVQRLRKPRHIPTNSDARSYWEQYPRVTGNCCYGHLLAGNAMGSRRYEVQMLVYGWHTY